MYFLYLNDKCIYTNTRFINKSKTVVGSIAPIRLGSLIGTGTECQYGPLYYPYHKTGCSHTY